MLWLSFHSTSRQYNGDNNKSIFLQEIPESLSLVDYILSFSRRFGYTSHFPENNDGRTYPVITLLGTRPLKK